MERDRGPVFGHSNPVHWSKATIPWRKVAVCALFLCLDGGVSVAQEPAAPTGGTAGLSGGAPVSAAAPRLYRGKVIDASDTGAVVECVQVPPAPPKDGTAAPPPTRFFLRGAPKYFFPAMEVRFYALQDAPHRYVDFFNLTVTMDGLKFVRLDEPPPAVAAVPAPVPPVRAAEPPRAPIFKPGTKNPTPRLKGTSLDEPARRVGR